MAETAAAVANYFIDKALEEDRELTPMKLIKLVYLAHGWHLGWLGLPLIGEAVQAWKYGPVIESLYHSLKRHGGRQLDRYALIPGKKLSEPLPLEGFLDAVWTAYGHMSGTQLSTLTHQKDSPWDVIWSRNPGRHWVSPIIPDDLIRKYYGEKVNAIRAKQAAWGAGYSWS
jgi:uncharacterized phage-associated protein